MKIVEQSFEIINITENPLRLIEDMGRICYKSESLNLNSDFHITKKFVKMIIDRGHESVLEHANMSVKFITDRGVTHELVRHRLASYSQQSTRYCNFSKDKFDNELTFIRTPTNIESYDNWYCSLMEAEKQYLWMIANGSKPEIARSVLPNALKTEIGMTTNLRHWREIFKQRCSPKAHPQIRELMLSLLKECKQRIPIIFDDIYPEKTIKKQQIEIIPEVH